MNYAQQERAALVTTLRDVGPEAPTLCEGWNTRDLVAHLVIRERRPDGAAGMFFPPLAGHTDRLMTTVAARPWPELLDDLADGPPWFSPMRPIDRWVNLGEMFVHHEDVLRGGADAAGPWLPRQISAGMESALETPLKRIGAMTLKGSPAKLTLRAPDGREIVGGGSGAPVSVSGNIGELLLFAFGRAPVDVNFSGDDAAIAAVRGASRGI